MSSVFPSKAARPDRRRARTRAALLTAGRALFADRTVREVSVDEIVAAADVAKGSFYNHFPDKESLASELVRQVRLQLAERIDEANRGFDDPVQCLVRGLYVVFRFGLDEPESAKMLMRLPPGTTALDAPLNRRIVTLLSAGLKQGVFSDVGIEDGTLIVIGIAVAGQRRVMDSRGAKLTRDVVVALGAGMLRALGVRGAKARGYARDAAVAILETGGAADPPALHRQNAEHKKVRA